MLKRRALLIGVPEYLSDAIGDLPFIRNDMQELREALESSGYHVHLIGIDEKKPASPGVIRGAINNFCTRAKKDETLFLCFSGHGLHYAGKDYFVPYDASVDDPDIQEYLIPVDFGKKFEESAAETILFFIDACREGIELGSKSILTLRSWSTGKLSVSKSREIAFIFACEPGEVSRFIRGTESFSLFSKALAEVIHADHHATTFGDVTKALQNRLDKLADERGKARQKIRIRSEVGTDYERLNSRIICNGHGRITEKSYLAPPDQKSAKLSTEKRTSKMVIPFELSKKIFDFLISIPNIYDINTQRALIFSAGLDQQLQHQIHFSGPPAQFFQLLIPTLISYGKLEDGRDALEAVLEAAKQHVGKDRRESCDMLIQELRLV